MIPLEHLHTATILVIDDEEVNLRLLESVLQRAGFTRFKGCSDARQAVALYHALKPDLVLLDLRMPYLTGFEVMTQLGTPEAPPSAPPVLVLTADATLEAKKRALSLGARDFLAKPFDTTEVLLRIKNLLEVRFLYRQLQSHTQLLEDRLTMRTRVLDRVRLEVVERLARAAEYRDDDTGQHTQRVGRYAAAVAKRLGLSESETELIRRAAPLHDVGKIGVPDAILLKPGKLTPTEFETVKRHTVIGAELLANGESELLQMAERIALSHHERWDGSGYPRGLMGDAIPLEGRIVAVADVFDALTHTRPYKAAWPTAQAIAEITALRGKQFDPVIAEIFVSLQQLSPVLD